MNFRWITLAVILVIILGACSSGAAPQIEVQEPWARAVSVAGQSQMGDEGGEEMKMGGINSAAYMILKNNTGQTDRLLRADSDVADAVELHLSQMVDGVMKMQPQESIEVPAKGQLALKPGSYHIMLIGLNQDLVVGDTFTVVLEFETAGEMVVEVTVREP